MNAPRLHLQGISHAYALTTVIADIGLTLEAGRVYALVGPSGCGKTTLLHLCAGLLKRQSGTLESSFLRPAVMFQQPRLLPWKSTRQNIALGLKAAGLSRDECYRRAQDMGQAVGLDSAALDQFPNTLSGGMQSRAALARALVLAPDLMLMDEPFSALDIGLKEQLHRLLLEQQAARGLTVLMITHDLMEAVRLADTVLVMASDPGRIVHRFDPAMPAHLRDAANVYRTTGELLETTVVRQCFGLPALLPSPAAQGLSTCALHPASPIVNTREAAPVKPKKGFSC